ncbi:T9SS type B sorting domain-containing protein [Costertonia aggregata]|uniref:T9SS type B sorting domain-containing protein n=1 Tax=Costertonia aggregata TaxID=343403 RepID=A0A7H9AS81_9FLAO|nr:T9SS type B sorting domain-containing protein [Costertonia aggregata]QLG46313.1 T9SS type B sorting domain-containing protein [Costertonia aggregata]
MLKRLPYIILLFSGFMAFGQSCPSLVDPLNGATNVPVTTAISWDAVTGVPNYRISIGTSPGGTDVTNGVSVGNVATFTPPLGLPDNTLLYVTVILDFFNSIPDVTCNIGSFRTEDITIPPPCTRINNPVNGAIGVNVATNISWDYAISATGYRINVGTSPGGTEIANNLDVGNSLFYNPPSDLPPSTPIYVTIVPYNDNNPPNICIEETFITGIAAALPNCATMISPINGATNVPLTPLLEWTDIPGATGYRVTIGTSPVNGDILDNVIFSTNSTFVLDFDPNRTFFIRIIPFNDAGEAIGCGQESFSTLLGCGPFFDVVSGDLVILNPETVLPDAIGICLDESPTIYNSPDDAEGYRWFRINTDGSETLISSNREVSFTEQGNYRYEVFNTVSQFGNTIECPTSKEFSVVASESPTITALNFSNQNNIPTITVQVSGEGNYEFSLNDINGPYQDSNVFNNVTLGSLTVYARDKNGCGIDQETFEPDLTVEGFPKFFTPNGDTNNDLWQFIPPPTNPDVIISTIRIFDRYGTLLKEIDEQSQGWDGTFNGRPMPASDYWFLAIDENNKEISGHFTLKR